MCTHIVEHWVVSPEIQILSALVCLCSSACLCKDSYCACMYSQPNKHTCIYTHALGNCDIKSVTNYSVFFEFAQ